MSPTWYDVLDVEPTVTAEEIRAAWQQLVADLGPTDRRFRVVNEAAEVLLDPQRRAAYDAELAASVPATPEPAPEPVTPVTLDKPAAPTAGAPVGDEPPTSLELQHIAVDRTPRGGVPGWLLIGVAIVTAVAAGVTAWLWVAQPSDTAVEDATASAQSVAERAAVPILSYDFRHLDRDQSAAQQYLTSGFRKDYDKLFAVIQQNAPTTRTKVSAEVIASGIVRSGENRVQVFLLINQGRTDKTHKTPDVFKNWVTLSMQKVGGDWLVDDMAT
ncbi:MAG: heat shock protein DnaJ domain protein [Nocardioides sp.]|nr:heat shock protein DnaJ domain protein [Nocardioides sp.]